MERFVRTSVDDLELLLAADECDLEDVAYPPRCPARGPLRMRQLEAGAVKIEVERRDLSTDDFRLAVLFHGGSCVFSGAEDVAGFFRGPVARAFGIEVEPLPEPDPPSGDLLDDLRPTSQASAPTVAPTVAPRKPARKAKSRPPVPRSPRAGDLADRLALDVHGQPGALGRVAEAVATQLAKPAPARPASILLLGPTGTGKTSTIQALPEALRELGRPGVHVFRIDCNELVHGSDLRRFLGAPPSYIGYVEDPPFFVALRTPRCIVLLDEIEKATRELHSLLLGLLDEGRLGAPDGTTVDAPGIVVAMTSNEAADDLAFLLRDVPQGSRAEQTVCREHLLRLDWPAELVGRIGTFAAYDSLGEDSLRGVAERAIVSLAREFALELDTIPPVLADVVRDLADASDIGARSFDYAARDLLTAAFAEATREGVKGQVAIDPGPPPAVVAAERVT